MPATITPVEKVVYTARARTTGGREGGHSRTDDGRLDVDLTHLGAKGTGTNPEQLFAAGWSACFFSAIKISAAQKKLRIPETAAIDAEVDLGTNEGGYQLRVRFNVSLPGIERAAAQELVEMADQICPYSKATRGNIEFAARVV